MDRIVPFCSLVVSSTFMPKQNRTFTTALPADDSIEQELNAIFAAESEEWFPQKDPGRENRVVLGRVLRIHAGNVWVDIGAKCPGIIPLREWQDSATGASDPPQPGDPVEVFLVSTDDATGEILLSRREVLRMKAWPEVTARYREGDRVQGDVRQVVKGGLLVDIGIPAFLPTSQIDIRRPVNLGDYVGYTLECFIVQIDEVRHRIVLSRRRLIEHVDPMLNRTYLATMEPGQVRVGVVKNIADFGVFVDLGGIDGLLHVRDMCWGRGIHPRQVFAPDQQVEVVLLQVDPERVKISLGLRHKVVPANWLTPSVLSVAKGIAETNDAAGFPILADTLEDAGCEDATLLSHLRGPDPRRWGDALVASLAMAALL